MNKTFKFFINAAILFLMCAFVSAAEQRSHSAPALDHVDNVVATVKRAASWPQLPEKSSYARRMAEIERDTLFHREKSQVEHEHNHRETKFGLISNMEEVDRDVTCYLIFLASAFNVYQTFQSLAISEFGIGILGLCCSTYLSLKLINKADEAHSKKFGTEFNKPCRVSVMVQGEPVMVREEPVPTFWYQTQYVYYGVLGALFCASLMNYLDHSRLAYFLALGSFNAMLSSGLMALLNSFSMTKGDSKVPFPMLYNKSK